MKFVDKLHDVISQELSDQGISPSLSDIIAIKHSTIYNMAHYDCSSDEEFAEALARLIKLEVSRLKGFYNA